MKTAAPLPAGTLLANGRYQLQQVLGQGGFAITYLALDTQLKRTVAIKELCPQGCVRDAHNQVASITLPPDQFAQIRQRFVEEAQLVAQLNHPGIVRIYDVFQQNNTGYMVMEYLHGETLGAKLKRAGGVLPVDEAVDYILQVCDALEVVHRAGYIHRDIKPDNIIHCEDERLVLIDFGAARHFVANQTATYTVMLTPSYAAPEQYSSAGRLDPRTDIYGLAATLYHLVTGVPPLPALDRTSGFDLPAPHLVEPEVGEALSDAILQGLAMRMDERPASVAEFAQLINEALEEDLQPPASVPSSAQSPPASVPSSVQPPPASVPSSAQSPPASVPPPAQSPPMPKPTRHASAWKSVWLAGSISAVVVILFLISRPFVSELISPTVIELSPEDTQETIIKAFERIRPEGTIRLESGSYYIDTDIVIEKPIKLVGVSGSVSFGTYHKSLVFRAEGDSQVQNITFQNTAIRVKKGAVAISSCNFTADGANYSAIKATNATSVRVEGCVIRGYHRGIFADGNAVLKAYNNICESHKQSGISLFGSAQGEVEGNTCRNNGYHGIYTDEQSRLVARNNTCEGNRYSGIALFGSAQGEVEGNTCRNNMERGIYAREQSRLVARNNTCEGNKDSGISLFGSAQGDVSGNTCRNNGYHGIYADEQSRLVARNNTCERNKQDGISLFGSAQGEVVGNTCRNNGYEGIAAQDRSRLVARNNTCEGNKRIGIALFGSAQGEVSGNACRSNRLHGIYAENRSRLIARNNTCEGNKDCGIFLTGKTSGIVENNTCKYNSVGIYSERTVRAYVGYNEYYINPEGNLLLNQ
jgi:parallel beta-helix repeat protein